MKNTLFTFFFISFLFMGCSKEEDDYIGNNYVGKYKMDEYERDGYKVDGRMDIHIGDDGFIEITIKATTYEVIEEDPPLYFTGLIALDAYMKGNDLYNKKGDKFIGKLMKAPNKDLILLRDNLEYYFRYIPLNE